MTKTRFFVLLAAVVILIVVWRTAAQSAPVALTGVVSSQQEGAMEGVLVSAKRAGSTVTVTVATDAQGRYAFPRNSPRARRVRDSHSRDWLRARWPGSVPGRGAADRRNSI